LLFCHRAEVMPMKMQRFPAICLLAGSLLAPLAAWAQGTVLITGANRGIGLALAAEFVEGGFEVIGTARDPEKATELRATGARVEALDVTSADSVAALSRTLDGLPIDILINNAGIKGQDSSDLEGLDMAQFETVMNVNTLGPMRVIQALYPNVRAGKRKIIANISSTMGSNELNTWGCCIAYRASKAALNNLSTTLAVDYGKQGLVVVTLHPGYVQTDMNNGNGNLTPAQSAAGLFRVISGLQAKDNGAYLDHAGQSLPW
jgi:NAD(P)-dependent dehydrogenase (short-subunit alcohol dehydrogenase family)